VNRPPGHQSELARQAALFAARGDMDGAAAVYRTLLEKTPDHAPALAFLSAHAFGRGEFEQSAAYARAAAELMPDDPMLAQNLGVALREVGRLDEARAALARAIRLQPDFATAQLHFGTVQEQLGDAESAIRAYARALQLEPQLERLGADAAAPAAMRGPVRRALAARRREHRALHDAILVELESRCGGSALERVSDFLRLFHGEAEPEYAHPLQKPDWQYFPGLEPRPFFEREEFAWIERLEAGWRGIRDELLAVLAGDAGIEPYVPGLERPPQLWRELSGSLDWSAFQLLKGGRPVGPNVARCPQSMAVIETLDLAAAPPHTPEAFFSILKPGTHIPPHFGLSNLKLAVHLALLIPASCGIRVGAETRHWEEGKCLIFDDSFEHEAWNRSAELRAVLIVEAWNPGLSGVEREAIGRIIAASESFNAKWQP
jgi:aspartate beta-hydroxylase